MLHDSFTQIQWARATEPKTKTKDGDGDGDVDGKGNGHLADGISHTAHSTPIFSISTNLCQFGYLCAALRSQPKLH